MTKRILLKIIFAILFIFYSDLMYSQRKVTIYKSEANVESIEFLVITEENESIECIIYGMESNKEGEPMFYKIFFHAKSLNEWNYVENKEYSYQKFNEEFFANIIESQSKKDNWVYPIDKEYMIKSCPCKFYPWSKAKNEYDENYLKLYIKRLFTNSMIEDTKIFKKLE